MFVNDVYEIQGTNVFRCTRQKSLTPGFKNRITEFLFPNETKVSRENFRDAIRESR